MQGPHDLFARFIFGHPERAAAELRAALPPQVARQVDWSSLRPEPVSVVDEELRETESDLVFSASRWSGRRVLFYFLIEHQSTVQRFMALRMLRYVTRLLYRWHEEHPDQDYLPRVFPLVVYHGREGPWTAPRRVEELFHPPDEDEDWDGWLRFVPRFEYLLDDLMGEREEVLRARPGPALVRIALLALRFAPTEELAQRLPGWRELFAEVWVVQDGAAALRAVASYLIEVGNEAVRKATSGVLRSALGAKPAEEMMMTVGEKLREEGRQLGRVEGRVEGRAEGLAEAVLRILSIRGVLVGEAIRKSIVGCTDVQTLEQWLHRAMTATRASDVVAQG